MSAAHVITVVKAKALKLRYNELTMQLTKGYVRAFSDSVNSKTAISTVERNLHVRSAKNEAR